MQSDTTTPDQVPDQAPAPRPRRAKRPAAVRQRDVINAFKAAKAAGVENPVVRIEPGVAIIISSGPPAVPVSPSTPLDQWMAKRARHA